MKLTVNTRRCHDRTGWECGTCHARPFPCRLGRRIGSFRRCCGTPLIRKCRRRGNTRRSHRMFSRLLTAGDHVDRNTCNCLPHCDTNDCTGGFHVHIRSRLHISSPSLRIPLGIYIPFHCQRHDNFQGYTAHDHLTSTRQSIPILPLLCPRRRNLSRFPLQLSLQ